MDSPTDDIVLTQTTDGVKLTPAQFEATRALASSLGHLWASVPDGTYNLADIEAYGAPLVDNIFGGISSPGYIIRDGLPVMVHTSQTGRIAWEVSSFGNVRLEIFRPADLFRRPSYAQRVEYAEEGIRVARVDLINDDPEVFDLGYNPDYIIQTSSRDELNTFLGHKFCYEAGLQDHLLFERHVWALVDLVAALLAPQDAGDPHRSTLRAANEILAPLFAKASPDPWEKGRERGHEKPRPETYWASDRYGDSMEVVHRGEKFPVETEMTAVYAVLLLRSQPNLSLTEAVKAAINAGTYRPGSWIEQ
ncbi:MAG TPA: hypothetical protein VNG90_03745 [Candidatus Acidoferrum sp.]|nr:hypothetical protein [Candidatus Acidoferrum sp.]